MEDLKRKLQDEIAALEYELRNELPKEILKARAHGDLRENAEFHAAKERQRFVDARLGQLKKRLASFSMVDLNKIPHDKVGFGSTVMVLDVEKDEEITYLNRNQRRGRRDEWQDLHHLADRQGPARQAGGRRGQDTDSRRDTPARGL